MWRLEATLLAATIVVAGCASDSASTGDSSGVTVAAATSVVPTSRSEAALPSTVAPTTTAAPATTTTTAPTEIPVQWSYSYGPDGFALDWSESFPAAPLDPAAGSLGRYDASGTLSNTGDMQGTGWYVFAGSEHPSGYAQRGYFGVTLQLFSGHVSGCGDGTAVMLVATDYTGQIEGSGHWSILDGYGTGDLHSMTGAGTVTSADAAVGGHGSLSGTVSCNGAVATPDSTRSISGTSVDFTASWNNGEVVADAGGHDFLRQGADPASGSLGRTHGHGTSHYGGDVVGIGRSVFLSVEHPGGWPVSAGTCETLVQFSGAVAGCGEGTMLLDVQSKYGPGTADPADPIEGTYTWTVINGYGTGSLTSVTGSGDGTGYDSDASGDGTFHGILNCSP
jgi:hypothetical protein